MTHSSTWPPGELPTVCSAPVWSASGVRCRGDQAIRNASQPISTCRTP
jgi:hypothetical protein